MMKVKLRRVHVRIDVTTERGQRKAVILSHVPRDGALNGALLRLVVGALFGDGMQLVDEANASPVLLDEPETVEAFRDTQPPADDGTQPLARLTVARGPAVPSEAADFAAPVIRRLPPASLASPSATTTAGADHAAPVRGMQPARRIEPKIGHPPGMPIRVGAGPLAPRADHVITPGAVAVTPPAPARRVAPPVRRMVDAPPVLPADDTSAPVRRESRARAHQPAHVTIQPGPAVRPADHVIGARDASTPAAPPALAKAAPASSAPSASDFAPAVNASQNLENLEGAPVELQPGPTEILRCGAAVDGDANKPCQLQLGHVGLHDVLVREESKP